MTLRNPFIKPPTPAPQIIYSATDATIACLCACLSYHKERNSEQEPYTFEQLDKLANAQLLGYCPEWDSLMKIIEAEAKKGVRYMIEGYDADDVLMAKRLPNGTLPNTDALAESSYHPPGYIAKIAAAVGVVGTVAWIAMH